MSHKLNDEDYDLNLILLRFFKKHATGMLLWGGIVGFCVVVIPGVMFYKQYIDQAAVNYIDQGLASFEKARLTGDASNYTQSQLAFQKVINGYALSSSSPIALLYMGNTFYQLGNYEEAKRAYLNFLKKYPRNSLAGLAQRGLAMSTEMTNDYEAAISEYQKLQQNYTAFVADDVRLSQARCLEEVQRVEEARKIYTELAPNNATAKARLLRLAPTKKA